MITFPLPLPRLPLEFTKAEHFHRFSLYSHLLVEYSAAAAHEFLRPRLHATQYAFDFVQCCFPLRYSFPDFHFSRTTRM